ncbi:hypothetical protein MHYP_G00242650 [Metynnis hypsauchen]
MACLESFLLQGKPWLWWPRRLSGKQGDGRAGGLAPPASGGKARLGDPAMAPLRPAARLSHGAPPASGGKARLGDPAMAPLSHGAPPASSRKA